MEDVFSTPEEAALASYSPAAKAFVVRSETVSADRVDVIVDTRPSHPMRVRCERGPDGWVEAGDIVE